MTAQLGQLAAILALITAIAQVALPLIGIQKQNQSLILAARPLALTQASFIILAFIALAYAFYSNDFSLSYVATNSNSLLPTPYRLAAIWGGHEGSMLLWVTVLAFWTVAVALFNKSLPVDFTARVISVLGMISVGFLFFILLTSNPFLTFNGFVPADGLDLNPLLQDPGMVVHPPTLYMGYVGFSVAFAFAIAALLSGKLDATWARWARPWTLAAWCFLTIGITMGSWWAYRELGWGGWWFWDPVENASFLPWLVGTALIHSLVVAEKRDAFKAWTVLLAITAFSLSLLGTFLVRSGVLTSVHAFATDPTRGAFMLGFLVVVIGGSLFLYALRANSVRNKIEFDLVSRETLLMSNNVLLLVTMLTVLLGTLYPLFIDALGMGKLSVGGPYFNAVFVPLMAPLIFLMGMGPHARWQQMPIELLLKQLGFIFVVSLSLAIALPLLLQYSLTGHVILGLALAFWVGLSMLQYCFSRKQGFKFADIGMVTAHIGVAVTIVGICLSTGYSIERDVKLFPGEDVAVGPYVFEFVKESGTSGSNYKAVNARFIATKNDKAVATLDAQKRVYTVQGQAMTEAGVDAGLFRDLYVALGEPLEDGAWIVRVYYKPFISWIWAGGFLMLIGGGFAFLNSTRSRRKHAK